MPSPLMVELFVSLVETGKGLDAMERFYAEDARMRENQADPRVGKAALLAHEAAAQAAVAGLTAQCVRPILVAGDTVVIRWLFEYRDSVDRPIRFEEIAYQRWVGDKISEEQFFYDPVQFRPRDAKP